MKKTNKLLNLSDKFCRKSLQDNVNDKSEYGSLRIVIFLLNMLMKTKVNLFLNMSIKINLNFFSNENLKCQPRT